MKRLTTVLFVLLTGLSLVSAAEADNATGGYIAITPNGVTPWANHGLFDIYGPEFSMTGQFLIDPSMNDFASATPMMPFNFSFTEATSGCGDTSSPLLMSLTVQGVSWTGSCATLTVTGQTTGPGYFSGTFSLDSSFEGGNFPFAVSGGGFLQIAITEGTSYVALAELYVQPSSSAVPEPSTMSLVLVGFGSLALIGRRRRSLTR
jgi:hypothetical protein